MTEDSEASSRAGKRAEEEAGRRWRGWRLRTRRVAQARQTTRYQCRSACACRRKLCDPRTQREYRDALWRSQDPRHGGGASCKPSENAQMSALRSCSQNSIVVMLITSPIPYRTSVLAQSMVFTLTKGVNMKHGLGCNVLFNSCESMWRAAHHFLRSLVRQLDE